MKPFDFPLQFLQDIDAASAAKLASSSSDIALIIDASGLVRDVSIAGRSLPPTLADGWIGLPWADVVTVESRSKVAELLQEALSGVSGQARHLNHALGDGADLPVLYSAVRVGSDGPVVALGRDLSALSLMQQRLVDAQQSIERDYARLRQLEARYRLLFQMTTEAVLMVDSTSQRIVEANESAARLLAGDGRAVIGRTFPEGLDEAGVQAVQGLFAAVRTAGRAEDVRVRRTDGGEMRVAASLVRQDSSALFLVRLAPIGRRATDSGEDQLVVSDAVEMVPDGFVLTDDAGLVTNANQAFLDLAQLASRVQVKGQPLERWLGRPGVDFKVLMVSLRQHGSVHLFSSVLRGEHGSDVDIEVSARMLPQGGRARIGFTVRSVGRRLEAEPASRAALPRSVEQLTSLVGRVSLKDLVRESTDLIEKLCIEAALELTRDNRASAAEMLGLSRQSLYVKLRRYGIGDLGGDEGNDAGGV
ncbi:transcriptional regulator PpsR [Methyloversatilis thermotolerans]|uniref:transcriptional regulator PpsR n=1 Tax=Methyloversatilis thermotolerans TaxID=1346290 RepID=UPI0003652A2D|nr:transcriptional regulator PpsR [Methyloversatilis thermotolerans]